MQDTIAFSTSRCVQLGVMVAVAIGLVVLYGIQTPAPPRHSVRLQACADLLHTRIAGYGRSCELVSRDYVSSELEQQWLDNVDNWQDDYCSHANISSEAVDTWLADIKRLTAGGAALDGTPDPAVFSRFITTYSCGTARNNIARHTVKHTTWIEPLAYGLRHPQAICGAGSGSKLMNRDYLLMATRHDYERTRLSSPCVDRTCRSWYFDLGAGTYTYHDSAGGHQPSQHWFYETYKQAGLEFDRMLMWEARIIPPDALLSQVPGEVRHKYQYFNVPVGVDPDAPDHPLQIMRKVVQEGDFVMVKLDLDTASVEQAYMKKLLSDSSLLRLVDEFFFEYHCNFQPMVKAGWGDTADPNIDLSDAYALFLKLRQQGVRAHSWV